MAEYTHIPGRANTILIGLQSHMGSQLVDVAK